jgi:hypothetical protein
VSVGCGLQALAQLGVAFTGNVVEVKADDEDDKVSKAASGRVPEQTEL